MILYAQFNERIDVDILFALPCVYFFSRFHPITYEVAVVSHAHSPDNHIFKMLRHHRE